MATSIEWADDVWNPTTGCDKVSPGCAHCYAETFAKRTWGRLYRTVRCIDARPDDGTSVGAYRPREFTDVRMHPERLDAPLHWRKPKRIFVNSMSDLFHESIPDAFIDKVAATMVLAPHHHYIVLTKRAERQRDYWSSVGRQALIATAVFRRLAKPGEEGLVAERVAEAIDRAGWPLKMLQVGVSVENQHWADIRLTHLVATLSATRVVSYEPALGPIDFRPWLAHIDQLYIGGESGPGARPCDVAWIRSTVEQCREAGVACFVKQLGAYAILDGRYDRSLPGWTRRLRDRKGADMSEWPEDVQVRELV